MSSISETDSIHRHPLAFSALVIGVFGGILVAMEAASNLLSVEWSVITNGIVSGAVQSLLAVLVISRLGLWRELGLAGRPARRWALVWFLPFALQGFLPLLAGVHPSAGEIAAAVPFGVLIAFGKLAALGLVLYAWLPRGARAAAGLSALFWGGMHVGGILAGGIVAPTLVEALSYVFLGFAFVSVRLRAGLLWPVLCCYALFLSAAGLAFKDNGASNLVASVSDVLPAVFTSLLLAGYGLLVWRRGPATVETAGHLGDGSEGPGRAFAVPRGGSGPACPSRTRRRRRSAGRSRGGRR